MYVKINYFFSEQLTKKYVQLRKENEEQSELLIDAENREQSIKQELRKLERAYSILEKRLKEYEAEVRTALVFNFFILFFTLQTKMMHNFI